MPNIHPHAWILLFACLAAISRPPCAGAQEAEKAAQASKPPKSLEEGAGEPEPLSPDHHPWARFPVGASRTAEIIEQMLDEDGKIANRSKFRRTETLRDVGPQQVTIDQKVTLELGGESVTSPATSVTLGLATNEPGTVQSFTEAPPEMIPLDGRDVEARVLVVKTGGEAYAVRTQLWYSPNEPPYLLRSISEAVVPASEETVWRRSRRVLARELPFELGQEQVNATFWEEEHVSTKGAIRSIIVSTEEVPGGVLARWTKETNTQGRLIRHEMERLLEWTAEPE